MSSHLDALRAHADTPQEHTLLDYIGYVPAKAWTRLRYRNELSEATLRWSASGASGEITLTRIESHFAKALLRCPPPGLRIENREQTLSVLLETRT